MADRSRGGPQSSKHLLHVAAALVALLGFVACTWVLIVTLREDAHDQPAAATAVVEGRPAPTLTGRLPDAELADVKEALRGIGDRLESLESLVAEHTASHHRTTAQSQDAVAEKATEALALLAENPVEVQAMIETFRLEVAKRKKEDRLAQAAAELREQYSLDEIATRCLPGVLGSILARKRTLAKKYKQSESGPGVDLIARIKSSTEYEEMVPFIESLLLQARIGQPLEARRLALRLREACLDWDREYPFDSY